MTPALTIAEIVAAAAKAANIAPTLLLSVCTVESGLRPHAINKVDGNSPSYGICQIKVDTAKMMRWESSPSRLLDPSHNALVAAHYLQYQLMRYKGDIKCAVAAYNAGTCRKNERGQIRNGKYLRKVRSKLRLYSKVYGDVRL